MISRVQNVSGQFSFIQQNRRLVNDPVFQTKIKQGIDSSHNNTSLAFNCSQQLGSQKKSNINDKIFRKYVL